MTFISLIRAAALEVWSHASAAAREINRALAEAEGPDTLGCEREERVFQPPAPDLARRAHLRKERT
ncbi:MAG TPA: hypothetical protein VGH40_13325 [Roseiarcus sp.]|jgi:hypothetical protein